MEKKLPILTLYFNVQYVVGVKIAGLSFKALKETRSIGHRIVRSDTGYPTAYEIPLRQYSTTFNNNTCTIKKEALIQYLKELYEVLPFSEIKIVGYYEATGEELYNEVVNA
jgi:hypothetical protein